MSGNFNMNFDPVVKQQFAEILAEYGLTVPQAFKLFANQVIKTKVVPLTFDWKANEAVQQEYQLNENIIALLEQNQIEQLQGKSTKYRTIDDMMADLKHETT